MWSVSGQLQRRDKLPREVVVIPGGRWHAPISLRASGRQGPKSIECGCLDSGRAVVHALG